MLIEVNGQPHEVRADSTVADLLQSLDIRVPHVAVERNREIVPRAEHGATTLCDGDQLEVVTLVGGG